jgi:putative oxidoreductase
MNILRTVCAVLLALPFLIFGLNHFLHFFRLPSGGESPGARLLEAMRAGGLMNAIAASHVLIGVLLLVPQTSFLAALLQLPITIGILSFHVTMLPEGNMMAAILLLLNVGALADRARLAALLGM